MCGLCFILIIMSFLYETLSILLNNDDNLTLLKYFDIVIFNLREIYVIIIPSYSYIILLRSLHKRYEVLNRLLRFIHFDFLTQSLLNIFKIFDKNFDSKI